MGEPEDGLTSMTGYGRATTRLAGWELRVDCRSVNHERLSLRLEVPDELSWIEPRIADRLRDRLDRGRVKIRIELDPSGGSRVDFDRIDEDRFSAVADQLKRLAADAGLAEPVSLGAISEYRDFYERSTDQLFSEDQADGVMAVVDRAIGEMIESRRAEGRGVARDLAQMIESLEAHLHEVRCLRQESEDQKWSRVQQRLREAVEQFEIDEIDDNRLAREVAYYVEKGDIAEEIQRTGSHLEKLADILDDPPSGAVGKKIDFYLQELVRETNTMSSKSRRPALTDRVIEMKSIVEKMREQAANVE